MTVIKQAAIELVFLTLASVGVALAANQIRDKGHIQLSKNYFDKGSGASKKQADAKPGEIPQSPPSPVKDSQPAASNGSAIPTRAPDPAKSAAAENAKAASKKPLEHEFQTITVDEAHTVLDDEKTAQGLNVFVDARDEEHFAEGHIPGAMRCFPYESEQCLDKVKAAADGAEKVIVYCGGGDCEDSIFMSAQLQEAGVPYEAIYLFEGGWKEWAAKGLHSETGSK